MYLKLVLSSLLHVNLIITFWLRQDFIVRLVQVCLELTVLGGMVVELTGRKGGGSLRPIIHGYFGIGHPDPI